MREYGTTLRLSGLDDDILEKTAEHGMPTGDNRNGYILFLLKDVNYLWPRTAGTKFRLTFEDRLGKTYELTHTMNGTPSNQGIYVPGGTGR